METKCGSRSLVDLAHGSIVTALFALADHPQLLVQSDGVVLVWFTTGEGYRLERLDAAGTPSD